MEFAISGPVFSIGSDDSWLPRCCQEFFVGAAARRKVSE